MKELIRDIPDFPIKGVMFRDIGPLLGTPSSFAQAIDRMTAGADFSRIDCIAGIESRGFILGSAIAHKHGKGFVPVRKAGKLPPPVVGHSYQLEYGSATIEMQKGTGRVLLVDDVLATGGTLDAAIALCQKAGYEVADVAVLIDLQYLNRYRWRERPIRSVIQYANV